MCRADYHPQFAWGVIEIRCQSISHTALVLIIVGAVITIGSLRCPQAFHSFFGIDVLQGSEEIYEPPVYDDYYETSALNNNSQASRRPVEETVEEDNRTPQPSPRPGPSRAPAMPSRNDIQVEQEVHHGGGHRNVTKSRSVRRVFAFLYVQHNKIVLIIIS